MIHTWLPLFTTSLATVASIVASCNAEVIVDPTKSPEILRPDGADVWTVGQVQTIRWSNAGLDINKEQGRVLLGYHNPTDGSDNEYITNPLADGFFLADEVLNIVVPDLPSGPFYWIVLLGNAANWSPMFTIINPASPTISLTNVTFPEVISVKAAPSATVSHSSSTTHPPSSSTSSASPTATQSTSAAARGSEILGLRWLCALVLGVSSVFVF
ncbi:hypothetical protein GY45DRAFT_938302 [Cubamyces sp. BRFM 1775]|nr:hypothetical protein GY45DRAFT_938302 [Cubamyces sp. BRFM 1775]